MPSKNSVNTGMHLGDYSKKVEIMKDCNKLINNNMRNFSEKLAKQNEKFDAEISKISRTSMRQSPIKQKIYKETGFDSFVKERDIEKSTITNVSYYDRFASNDKLSKSFLDPKKLSHSPLNNAKLNNTTDKINVTENKPSGSKNKLRSQWNIFLTNKDAEFSGEKPSDLKTAYTKVNKSLDNFSELNNFIKSKKENRSKYENLDKDITTSKHYHRMNNKYPTSSKVGLDKKEVSREKSKKDFSFGSQTNNNNLEEKPSNSILSKFNEGFSKLQTQTKNSLYIDRYLRSSVKIRDMTSNIRSNFTKTTDMHHKKLSVDQKNLRQEPQKPQTKNHNFTDLFQRFDSKLNPNKSTQKETYKNDHQVSKSPSTYNDIRTQTYQLTKNSFGMKGAVSKLKRDNQNFFC